MYLQLSIVFVTLFQIALTEKCVTPNNEEAKCVSIYSCKILIDALKTDQNESIEFVRKSKCEGRESDRMVCCGSTSRFLTEKCVTPNNEQAKCVPISSCEVLIDAFFKAEQSDINEFVRKSKCEGGESDRMVCCGSTSRFLTEKCVTPNDEEATCVSIYSCKILIDALKTEQNESIEFVRKSKCEGRESDRMVCCGSTSSFSAPLINKNADKDKLLPERTYCGYQHSDDYVRNETGIGINEFPWLAGLVYNYGNITGIGCTGSLISNRYVLTSRFCLLNENKLTGVRLGEYDVTTDEDCTEDSGFYECSTSPEPYDIEKIIPYPEYNNSLSDVSDIGLLRLSKKVDYSDYIRPICLPTAGTMFAKPGDILLTSGWGIKQLMAHGEITETKKKIPSKLITSEECMQKGFYEGFRTESLLCTKELENNTEISCAGDYGGPAIFSFRNQWHQEGVLSFTNCSSNYPVVYMRIVYYLDWIKENIEP